MVDFKYNDGTCKSYRIDWCDCSLSKLMLKPTKLRRNEQDSKLRLVIRNTDS